LQGTADARPIEHLPFPPLKDQQNRLQNYYLVFHIESASYLSLDNF
jgi:hypothetical protein